MLQSNRSTLATALTLISVAFAAACGSDDGMGPGGGDMVEIQATASLTFSPDQVAIEPGTTVRWVNDSGLFHTVTPDGHSEFGHHDLPSGQTFEHTFTDEGTFPYYCQPHLSQGMTGTIIVQSSGTNGPTY